MGFYLYLGMSKHGGVPSDVVEITLIFRLLFHFNFSSDARCSRRWAHQFVKQKRPHFVQLC